MAYVFKLPPTVTEEIMRYAVGYPRDRLRAIAADVVRTEGEHRLKPWSKTVVSWKGSGRGENWFSGRFRLVFHDDPPLFGLPSEWKYLERDREVKMRLLQDQCEACEPAELQLQRTHF